MSQQKRPAARGSDLPAIDVKDLRDREEILGLDPDTIEAGRHYRWVQSSPQRIARHKMRGYRFVTKEDGVLPVIPVDEAGDGTIRVGDMVLMSCAEDAYRGRRQLAEDTATFRTSQAGKDVRKSAKKKGVRTFTREPNEDDDDE